jgi:hypothetical protein
MNHYKKITLFLFTCLFTLKLFSQTAADSISPTFPKVVFVNKNKEILLTYDDNRKAYEVISYGFIEGPIDFNKYIDTLAKDIGIIYTSYRLGGLFTYIFPNSYSTFIRPYFVVSVDGFVNKKGVSDTTCKWFTLKDALYEIKYPASAKIVEKILTNPKQVWSATFEEYGYTNPVDKSKIKFRIVTDFQKIN